MEQGKVWYIEDNIASHGGAYSGTILWADFNLTSDSISISVSGVTTTTSDKDNFFYNQPDTNNIRTKIGGTYDITINCSTHKITAMTLKSVDLSDFMILGRGISFGSGNFNMADGFSATSVSGNGTTIDFNFGSKTFRIADQFKAARTYDNGASNPVLSNSFSGLTSYFDTTSGDNSNIYSRTHITATVVVKLTVSSGSFSIAFSSGTETTPNNITFKHARAAGIFVEIADNSSFTNSTIQMMHTTSGDYRVQEAPISLISGQYFRIFETHSNTTAENNTLTTDSAIRAATEWYYYTMANSMSGFTQNSGSISAATGRWTISLTNSNTVHIATYSGASTDSSEHLVPYYLIGRGMPGSDIRGCDYTTAKGIQMYTYGNNPSNVPCYIGDYPGDNRTSSNYQGPGISLKAGDEFKFATASKVVSYAQSASDNSYRTITAAGQVTIKQSGTFKVYLTGSEGSEVIHVDWVSAGSEWSRNGSIVGVTGTNGNSISFGANLDYSLLDAYGASGYTFVVRLAHTSQSAGNVTYTITNSNGYQITVAKYNGDYANNNSYTGSTNVAGSNGTYNGFTRAIAAGSTTYTCIQVTLKPEQIRSMISSGSYTFSMTISYAFVETSIS